MAVKVFCSHRSVDKPEVEAFATLLRKKGIDAWFDRWEIAPGDDIVARPTFFDLEPKTYQQEMLDLLHRADTLAGGKPLTVAKAAQ